MQYHMKTAIHQVDRTAASSSVLFCHIHAHELYPSRRGVDSNEYEEHGVVHPQNVQVKATVSMFVRAFLHVPTATDMNRKLIDLACMLEASWDAFMVSQS